MIIHPPADPEEFAAYYDLRWRVLRAPWNQPRGTEKDDRENQAIHLCAFEGPLMIGVGRLHHVDGVTARIRYMAVRPGHERRGIGRALLNALEQQAIDQGASRIELNARESAVPFYLHAGYRILRAGPTLWDIIPHQVMEKALRSTGN